MPGKNIASRNVNSLGRLFIAIGGAVIVASLVFRDRGPFHNHVNLFVPFALLLVFAGLAVRGAPSLRNSAVFAGGVVIAAIAAIALASM